MGVSYKFVKFLEAVYSTTQSVVWTGEEYSESFESKSDVKQGCLISPLLFALYINDRHECLEGGLMVENLNIRLLLYVDDIVILADDINTMQGMIENLEIVVFRNNGTLRNEEKWVFKGAKLKIASEFKYLGVVFTPKLKFSNHLEKRKAQTKKR